MSLNFSPQPDDAQPTYRRLKLVVSTPEYQYQASGVPSSNTHIVKAQSNRSSSPARPSYSPVTPTLSQSSANGQEGVAPEWVEEPESLPVSLDDNVDAIALQATLSLLQMQRQQSLKDIRTLDKMRQAALEDPETFVRDLRNGKLSKPALGGVALDSDIETSDDDEKISPGDQARFGQLPNSQNIARCPPIEWAKYRVVGPALDQLHENQRQRPGATEESLRRGVQTQSDQVVAPYRPFVDKLDPLPPSSETRDYGRYG